MHRDLRQWPPWPARVYAGAKIVETLTFTRANRVQVMVLEKDIFHSELCMTVRRCACKHVHKCIGVGWVRLLNSIGSHIAPGPTIVAASVAGWLMESGAGSQHSGSLMNLHLFHTAQSGRKYTKNVHMAITDQVWWHIERFGWTEAAEKIRTSFGSQWLVHIASCQKVKVYLCILQQYQIYKRYTEYPCVLELCIVIL